tara:strand:- start:193 stop:453 length:261 start_codon:yes stop_codon:yes gene_type:complete
MLPGIDMIRLSVTRLINNQSPFQGDNNHIHHFLINKFNYNKSIIIIFLLIFIPIILYNFLAINLLLIIFMNLIIYFLILKICSNKN